jgi:hypothetical protein
MITEPAAPSPAREPGKSLLEILIVPVTLALITAIVSVAGTKISAAVQEAQNERSFRSTQLAAVEQLATSAAQGDLSGIAPRLVAYEQMAIPALFGVLQRPDLASNNRTVVERSLVQIGVIYGHDDEVGRAMLMIIDDPWKLYDHETHLSAMKILSSICYKEARKKLEAYEPEEVVMDWADVQSNHLDKAFNDTWVQARRRLGSEACRARNLGGSP